MERRVYLERRREFKPDCSGVNDLLISKGPMIQGANLWDST